MASKGQSQQSPERTQLAPGWGPSLESLLQKSVIRQRPEQVGGATEPVIQLPGEGNKERGTEGTRASLAKRAMSRWGPLWPRNTRTRAYAKHCTRMTVLQVTGHRGGLWEEQWGPGIGTCWVPCPLCSAGAGGDWCSRRTSTFEGAAGPKTATVVNSSKFSLCPPKIPH